MTIQATERKIKRSFTLSPEAVAYVGETRRKRGAGSDSEAIDLLLREAMNEARQQEIEAACKEFYDAASEEQSTEQREWEKAVGAKVFLGARD